MRRTTRCRRPPRAPRREIDFRPHSNRGAVAAGFPCVGKPSASCITHTLTPLHPMQQGFRRLMALAAVFAVAFGAVYLIRNGPQGFARLWAGSKADHSQEFRPEHYTLSDRAPLELGDVQLLARLDEEYTKLTGAVVPSVVSIDTT